MTALIRLDLSPTFGVILSPNNTESFLIVARHQGKDLHLGLFDFNLGKVVPRSILFAGK